MSGAAALMVIVGSVVFLVGAGFGVPSVFMTGDSEERVRLLTSHVTRWRVAQFFYAGGPVIASIGVGWVGFNTGGGAGAVEVAAGAALLIGAVAWSYSCLLRGRDPVRFAQGVQPGWPFRTYVILTLAGLAALGMALLVADTRTWVGWVVLAADLGYTILYVETDDVPPFVFYVLLIVAALAA
jgi:hypothetical protein